MGALLVLALGNLPKTTYLLLIVFSIDFVCFALFCFSRIRKARRAIKSSCPQKRITSQVSTGVGLPARRKVWEFTVACVVWVCSLSLNLNKNKSLP